MNYFYRKLENSRTTYLTYAHNIALWSYKEESLLAQYCRVMQAWHYIRSISYRLMKSRCSSHIFSYLKCYRERKIHFFNFCSSSNGGQCSYWFDFHRCHIISIFRVQNNNICIRASCWQVTLKEPSRPTISIYYTSCCPLRVISDLEEFLSMFIS